MSKIFEKMDSNPCGIYILMFIASILLFSFRYPDLFLPLMNDEWYYAHSETFSEVSKWTEISFGHPPGWNFLCGIMYIIFGQSPTVAHFLGIVCSLLSLIIVIVITGHIFGTSLAFFLFSSLVSHPYFLSSYSLSEPVITASHLGFLSLLALRKENYLLYALLTTCSVTLRESGLVFVIAGIMMQRNKKSLIYSIFPIATLFFFYIWYFIERNTIMMNFSIDDINPLFIFNKDHIFSFYNDLFRSTQPWIYGITFLLIPSILTKEFSIRFKEHPILIAFVIVFILHSLFFALYSGTHFRNTYYSWMAFICFIIFLFFALKPLKASPVILLIPLSLLIWKSNIQHLKDSNLSFNIEKNKTNIMKELSIDISLIKKKYPDINILTQFPIPGDLTFPHIGYIKEKVDVSDIYTCIISNSTSLECQRPDIIILINQTGDQKFSKILKEMAVKLSYKNIKTYNSSNVTAEIYSYKNFISSTNI